VGVLKEVNGIIKNNAVLNDVADVDVPSPIDGYILTWDAVTSRWKAKAAGVAAAKELLEFGIYGTVPPGTGRRFRGSGYGSTWRSGKRIFRDCVIRAISVQGRSAFPFTGRVEIWKNDINWNAIASLDISADHGAHITGLNVNLNAGDRIQPVILVDSTSANPARHLHLLIEIE